MIPGCNNCGWWSNRLWQILTSTYLQNVNPWPFSSPSIRQLSGKFTKLHNPCSGMWGLGTCFTGRRGNAEARQSQTLFVHWALPSSVYLCVHVPDCVLASWLAKTPNQSILCSYKVQNVSIFGGCLVFNYLSYLLRTWSNISSLCCFCRGTREDLSYATVNLRALCPGASAVPMLTSRGSTPRLETTSNGSTGSSRKTDDSTNGA